MHTIYLNTANKLRKIVYLALLILTSFILGVYFRENYLMLTIGSIMITLSIAFEIIGPATKDITAIILDDEYPNTISR